MQSSLEVNTSPSIQRLNLASSQTHELNFDGAAQTFGSRTADRDRDSGATAASTGDHEEDPGGARSFQISGQQKYF